MFSGIRIIILLDKLQNISYNLYSFQSYNGKDIVLTLPSGKTLKDVRWLSVWCRAFDVNFGEISFPRNLDYPRPRKIDPFNGIHEVGSEK